MEKKCSFDGCERVHESRGLCKSHAQQQREGRALKPIRTKTDSKEVFFLERVEKSSGCWNWMGKKTTHGYGQMKHAGTVRAAHRYSWELAHGELDENLSIDHLCHNPPCVNPDHLRAVSHRSNMENRISSHSNSKSGVSWVMWDAGQKNWRARVASNGKKINIGRFSSLEEANAAALEMRAKLFEVTD